MNNLLMKLNVYLTSTFLNDSESLSLRSFTKNLEEIETEVLPIVVAFETQEQAIL